MEEILKRRLETLAGQTGLYQLAIVILCVLLVVSTMAKHFKVINEAWPSILKVLQWIKNRFLRRALFEQDMRAGLTKLGFGQERIEERVARVEYEVKDNSGGSMKDCNKRIEKKLDAALNRIAFNELMIEAGYERAGRMKATFNRDAEMIDVNSVFLKFFGWTEKEMLGVGYENMVHEEDRQDLQVKFSRAIHGASKLSEPDLRMFDSDGHVHNVCITGYPHTNWLSGDVEKYFVTFEILNPTT